METNKALTFSSRDEHEAWLKQQSPMPAGFRAGTCEFKFFPKEAKKPGRMVLTLLALDAPTDSFAGVFTTNAFAGAPVHVARRRLNEQSIGALIVNNKISNVCAPDGIDDAEAVCSAVGRLLGAESAQVIPASTGVIGWKLPLEEMLANLSQAASSLQSQSLLQAARGIMTTDLYPKVRRASLGEGSIVGIAKGAGMIEPNLATMLVFILTDLDVPRVQLREALSKAVEPTFNSISIDSDQSTSDMVIVISSKKVPCPDYEEFCSALREVCRKLAIDIIRNGEGVHHVVQVRVSEAPNVMLAKGIGKSVVNSPLLQCAVCGNDPNVGRLVMAVGKYLGDPCPQVDVSKCRMSVGGISVFSEGAFSLSPEIEEKLGCYLKDAELYSSTGPDEKGNFLPPIDYPPHERMVEIDISLGCGGSEWTVWGSDRSHEYITENADYRS